MSPYERNSLRNVIKQAAAIGFPASEMVVFEAICERVLNAVVSHLQDQRKKALLAELEHAKAEHEDAERLRRRGLEALRGTDVGRALQFEPCDALRVEGP